MIRASRFSEISDGFNLYGTEKRDEILELLDFEKELNIFYRESSFIDKAVFFVKLVGPSLQIALSNLGSVLVNGFGLYIADRTGSACNITALGLSIFVISIMIYPLSSGINEKVGTSCSLAYGALQMDRMKVSLLKGLFLMTLTVTGVYLLLILQMQHILEWMNIDSNVATTTTTYLGYIFFFECTKFYRETVLSFMISQEIEGGFTLFSIFSLVLGIPTAGYLGLYRNMGVEGWIIGKGVYDLSNLILCVSSLAIKNKTGPIQGKHFPEILVGLKCYYFDVISYSITLYAESVGWELSTLFVAQTKNSKEIGAYSLLVNVAYVMWYIGNGFSCTSRSRLNFMIGRGKQVQAKKLFATVLVGIIFIYFILGTTVFFLKSRISELYSNNNPGVKSIFEDLLSVYSVVIVGDLLYSFIFTASRTTNQIGLNIFYDVILLICAHIGLGYYFMIVEKRTSTTALLILQILLISVHVLMIIRILSLDWGRIVFSENIPLERRRKDSDNMVFKALVNLEHSNADNFNEILELEIETARKELGSLKDQLANDKKKLGRIEV